MKKVLQSFLAISILLIGLDANSQSRFIDDVFSSVTVTSDITYATNISVLPLAFSLPPAPAPLKCDIYVPDGDYSTNRPVVILLHTGSFLPAVANGQPTGSKTDSSIVEQCTRWAKKGYVAVAMDNRLGWDALSPDQDTRTSTLLQAAYRGIQDAKAMVRYLRDTEANGNPYGIDESRIVLGGQGTGGYVSLAYSALDDPSVELNLQKFINFSDPSNPVPYVIPTIFGNPDGTDSTYFPANFPPFMFPAPFLWNIPNNPTYSSDINMAFNLGGCLADISWLSAGDVPAVSFHCAMDPYGPIDTGDVIVPTTGDFVVEVMGSRTVQYYQNQYLNNDAFASAGISDVWTTAANNYNNGLEGLFVFQTPAPGSPTAFMSAVGLNYEEWGSPWDWWDNALYETTAQTVNSAQGAPPGYFAADALTDNPDMSPTKGRAYIDTIQGYLNPRMVATLNLVVGCSDQLACNYDSLVTFDDNSCILPDGCTDVNACNYDSLALCDDGSCLTILGCTDTVACNYDANAQCDDGSCLIGTVGCTDIFACNYDSAAACDDGSCLTEYGCMNPAATNYDPLATCADTCIFSAAQFGCTDSTAFNFNPLALFDDGSCCLIDGCTDPLAINFDPQACYDNGSCIDALLGCTYSIACNYDPLANTDDGTCDFPNGCGDPLYNEYDASVTCSDPNACITLVIAGINESIQQSTLIYPNPANNYLNVISSDIKINSISVNNLQGQEVMKFNVNSNRVKLDLATLSKGVYFIDIKSEKTNIKRKFIIE